MNPEQTIASSARTHPMLAEQIHHHQWPNGLQLWLCPRPGRTVSVHLSVAAGSLDRGVREQILPAGTAHFLEHRLFEKQDGDLTSRFAALGADIDAETGYTHTSFICDVAPPRLSACLELLARLVLEPYFPKSAVEREREIILREIELYEDNVDWVAFQAATQALYPDQPIADDIAGTGQSLTMIDSAALSMAHTHLYRPDRMQLIVTGPVDMEQLRDIVEELFAGVPQSPKQGMPAHQIAMAEPRKIHKQLAIARPRLWMGIAGTPPAERTQGLKRELHLEWILDMLLGGASSFFSTHYESSLIDGDSFGSEIYVDESFSFCLVGGDTDDPTRLGDILLQTLSDPLTPDLLAEDFDRASRRAYGELVTSFEDGGSVQDFIETAVLRGCHPFDLVDLVLNTGADDLISTWQTSLRDCEPAWTVVGPDPGSGLDVTEAG